MRKCDICGSRMAPFLPRTRLEDGSQVCKGCAQRDDTPAPKNATRVGGYSGGGSASDAAPPAQKTAGIPDHYRVLVLDRGEEVPIVVWSGHNPSECMSKAMEEQQDPGSIHVYIERLRGAAGQYQIIWKDGETTEHFAAKTAAPEKVVLQETTKGDSPLAQQVRKVTVPALTGEACEKVMSKAPSRPPHVTRAMGERMARELAETGVYEMGWTTWKVVSGREGSRKTAMDTEDSVGFCKDCEGYVYRLALGELFCFNEGKVKAPEQCDLWDGREGSRKVAHDSGDGETIYHCPFCGAGQVIARSDGTAECGFCKSAFTVQVQPTMPAVPQTINGVPYENPDMPGTSPGTAPVEQDPNAIGDETALTPDEQQGEGGGGIFASKRYFVTDSGVALPEDAYLRHLAIKHADDRQAVIAAVRAEREAR